MAQLGRGRGVVQISGSICNKAEEASLVQNACHLFETL